MTIRYRPMRPNDVRECVEIIAAHPIVSARYGECLAGLKSAWLYLLSSGDSGTTVVFEEQLGANSTMVGVGVTAFVSDEFLSELKTPPYFWLGPELVKRITRGDSPLLSTKEVRDANSQGGLNLVVWQACIRMEAIKRMDVWDVLMAAFLEYHRGYLWKELVAHSESIEHMSGQRNTGGLLWDGISGRYREFWEDDLGEIISKPHLTGLTRDMALSNPGFWLGSLFLHEPPRFGFSRSEQRLLLAAANGETDQELSDHLGISLGTVKKTWRLIYERVAAHLPDLVPASAAAENGTSERGREKKQRLIAYLREHPEELRPVSRKLLQQNSPIGLRR